METVASTPDAAGRLRAVLGVVILTLVLVTMLVLPAVSKSQQTPVVAWFISLLVMLIVSLTATALILGGLGLGNPHEAFGLPAGSIRTLLAIGVMVLFAVFGLAFLGDAREMSVSKLSDKPVLEVAVDAAQLGSEIKRYEADQFVVVVASAGQAGAAASGNVAAVTAVSGKLQLYARDKQLAPGAFDLQKQIITAVITLLTSVVSFYFGSKSAAEGARAVAGGNPAPAAPAAQPDITALLAKLDDQAKRVTALRAQMPPADPGKLAQFNAALAALATTSANIESLRAKATDATQAVAVRADAGLQLTALSATLETQLATAQALGAGG